MTKMTAAGFERRFEEIRAGKSTEVVKRAVKLPEPQRKLPMCRVCRKPIPCGVGQIAYYHKFCRPNRKRNRQSVITPSRKIK